MMRVTTRSPEETLARGRQLGELLTPGDVVALCGPLGAGKTTFVKGVADGLGVPHAQQAVKSPTFVLIKEYTGRCPVAHVDLYRMETLADAERLDLHAYCTSGGVCLIEWAEKFPALLPAKYLRVTFEHCAPTERHLTFTPRGDVAAQIVASLKRQWRVTTAPAAPRVP